MPSPKKGESKKKFLQRCMGDPESNKDFPDQKQRYAVCNSFWDQKKKKAKGTIENFDGDEILFGEDEE